MGQVKCTLNVLNIECIKNYYGIYVAQKLIECISHTLIEHCVQKGVEIYELHRDLKNFEISFALDYYPVGENDLSAEYFTSEFCLEASSNVFEVDDFELLAACVSICDVMRDQKGAECYGNGVSSENFRRISASLLERYYNGYSYRVDMAAAVSWVHSFHRCDFHWAWQKVDNMQDASPPLFHFGRLCGLDKNGQMINPVEAINALRRLGLGFVSDLAHLRSGISLLRDQNFTPIAIDITSSTIQLFGPFLKSIITREGCNTLNKFSILLISDHNEKSIILSDSIEFLLDYEISLGVQIGNIIDWSQEFISFLNPDFAVIPSTLVRPSLISREGVDVAATLVALAQLVAPKVIVQGIDTPLLAAHAQRAGVVWGQGGHFSLPSWQRPMVQAGHHVVNK